MILDFLIWTMDYLFYVHYSMTLFLIGWSTSMSASILFSKESNDLILDQLSTIHFFKGALIMLVIIYHDDLTIIFKIGK